MIYNTTIEHKILAYKYIILDLCLPEKVRSIYKFKMDLNLPHNLVLALLQLSFQMYLHLMWSLWQKKDPETHSKSSDFLHKQTQNPTSKVSKQTCYKFKMGLNLPHYLVPVLLQLSFQMYLHLIWSLWQKKVPETHSKSSNFIYKQT